MKEFCESFDGRLSTKTDFLCAHHGILWSKKKFAQ